MKRLLLGSLLCAMAAGCGREAPEKKPDAAAHAGARPAAHEEVVAGPPLVETRRDARAEAAAIRDREKRLAAHERLLAEALAQDPREAVAWVLDLEDRELAAILLDEALVAWAELDPRAAGAHVAALPESDYRAMLSGELAAAWAAKDAGAATRWAAGLGDQEAREEALRGALGRVAKDEPRKAAELALRTTGEGDRAATLERVVEAWWERDPRAVEAWAAGLVETREKDLAGRLVAARKEANEGR